MDDQMMTEGNPVQYWVDARGVLQPGTDDPDFVPDPSWLMVTSLPQFGDQIYNFATGTWGPSLSNQTYLENSWREAELAGVPDQIAMIEDDDPAAVGTVQQWRDYRKALRLWVEGGAGFPFGDRPVRPS